MLNFSIPPTVIPLAPSNTNWSKVWDYPHIIHHDNGRRKREQKDNNITYNYNSINVLIFSTQICVRVCYLKLSKSNTGCVKQRLFRTFFNKKN